MKPIYNINHSRLGIMESHVVANKSLVDKVAFHRMFPSISFPNRDEKYSPYWEKLRRSLLPKEEKPGIISPDWNKAWWLDPSWGGGSTFLVISLSHRTAIEQMRIFRLVLSRWRRRQLNAFYFPFESPNEFLL